MAIEYPADRSIPLYNENTYSEKWPKLVSELGEDNLPRNVFYGDGEPIEDDALDHIRQVYEQQKITFQWHQGDILLIDNILIAHGREIFKGERKIAVAMAEEF